MSRICCFTTNDPLGNKISLYEDTWHSHICERHPEMCKFSTSAIEATVKNPNIITDKTIDPSTNYYTYKHGRDLYLKVAVRMVGSDSGEVATAYLLKNIPEMERIIHVKK